MIDQAFENGPAPAPQRRREAMADWRRRSRLVHRFRRWLPIIIAVVLLGLLGAVVTATLMGRAGEGETDQTTIRMVNPRFVGRDKGNQAFVLSAKEATRISGSASKVRLSAPVMVFSSEAPRPTRVVAETGVYDEVTEVLELQRGVVFDSAGGRFTTDEAIVDSKAREIRGSAPIQGVGPTGRIADDAYHLYDAEGRMTFTGGVRARLEPDTAAGPISQGETR